MKFEIVEPDPAALIESLRSFGYSLETAIADLVDNSVTAGASNIEIAFNWTGPDSWITVLDDGSGIEPERLNDVMRPGSTNPLDDRDPGDLGRFGLGLKTASFSQARSLTVLTRKDPGPPACRRWDLDHVGRTRQWQLLMEPRPESEDRLGALDDMPTGTLVLWENLDRVVDGDATDSDARHFYESAAKVEQHLAAVFQRFLGKKLQIRLNGNSIQPWDPFCTTHDATQPLPEERLPFRSGSVLVRPFVLPHHSLFEDKRAHQDAGGIKGWNAQQGFYLYRGDRLILSGGWIIGGFKPEEHHKLARISIDIDQTMDADWALDVRKSRARPPAGLIDDLIRIARTTRSRASEVYRHRGTKLTRLGGPKVIEPTWKARKQGGAYHYTINRKHPLVVQAESDDVDRRTSVRALIDLLEGTLPVERIAFDAYRDGESIGNPESATPSGDLLDAARAFIDKLVSAGTSLADAKAALLAVEPFSSYPDVVEAMG
ncbi:MAG: ATP-binding protein [Acidimicrobiales bacterium]